MYLHVSVSEMSFLYLGHVLQQSPEERHPPPAFVPPPPVTITAATPESESPPSLNSGKYRCFVVQIVIVIEYMIFLCLGFLKNYWNYDSFVLSLSFIKISYAHLYIW